MFSTLNVSAFWALAALVVKWLRPRHRQMTTGVFLTGARKSEVLLSGLELLVNAERP